MFIELCLSSRHKNLSTYLVSSSTVVSYMHIHVHAPFVMYCSTLFVVDFHIFKHDIVHRVTELHLSASFMFVSAAVSELRESNQNKKEKKKKKKSVSNLTPFLGI